MDSIFTGYVNALKEWFVVNRKRLISEGYTETQIQDALNLYEELGCQTTNNFLEEKEDQTGLLEAMDELVKNVLESGAIKPLPKKFEMSRECSIKQCKTANEAFTKRPDLQKLLADANYSFFTSKTMTTAKGLLNLSLDEMYDSGMGNLNIGNLSIGYMVKNSILENKEEREFHFIDLGSGSGATLASICIGIMEAKKEGVSDISITIDSYEACYAFKTLLENEMIPSIKEKLPDIKVNLHYCDLTEATFISLPNRIFTSNYVFHRITDDKKEKIIEQIKSTNISKTYFFFADMYRNTSSMPNRKYFNFALNGPLNPGNDAEFMVSILAKNGFFVDIPTARTNNIILKEVLELSDKARLEEQGFVLTAKYS